MKTKEVTQTGIDRNFLRKCVDEKIVIPRELDNEGIVNKNYIPKDYSQEDVETLWHAYLCRKMGLSYEQIKSLTKGEEISVRDSLIELIKKYEEQIEELQALIEFMKYVKGIGFIPQPPSVLMGSSSFKNYLTDFIKYIDGGKRLKKTFELVEYVCEVDDIETVDDDTFEYMESAYNELDIDKADGEAYSSAILQLRDKMHMSPASEEVQTLIYKIFQCQKKFDPDEEVTPWDFAIMFIYMLSNDSDVGIAYKKLLGGKTVDFFIEALKEFLEIQEPEKMEKIRAAYEIEDKQEGDM